MAVASGLVFVMAFAVFALAFFQVARTMWRGPHGMVDDLMDRAEHMQSRMQDIQRRHEPQPWECTHCGRRNDPGDDECDSCGAPAAKES